MSKYLSAPAKVMGIPAVWIWSGLILSGFYPESCPPDAAASGEAGWGEVVINEVMFDPDPPVKDFLGEYVELYNRSSDTLNLEGWILISGSREYVIGKAEDGSGEARVAPEGFFVVRGITLPNNGTMLVLRNSCGGLVHAATYRIPYGGPVWKEEGGWSLEAPDPHSICHTSTLWTWSTDPSGGSPGRPNTCDAWVPDLTAPEFFYAGFGEEGELNLYFSERIIVEPGWSDQLVIRPGNMFADTAFSASPLGHVVTGRYSRDPATIAEFTVSMPAPADCSGNLGRPVNVRAGSVIPPQPGSVVINEIMFDPREGHPWFIELLIRGPGFSDLSDLCLGLTGKEGTPKKYVPLSAWSRIIGTGDLVVVTRNLDHFLSAYGLPPSGKWVGLEDLTGMSVSGGKIYLADRSGNTLDLAGYCGDLHLEVVDETQGVSLERIDPDGPGTAPSSWHSAASIAGYCTPGRPNSQSVRGPSPGSLLTAEPRVFSPDNDGYNDLLKISAGALERGTLLRLWVTSASGRTIRVLANNHVGAPGTSYTWDGEDGDGYMVPEGFYVIHMKSYVSSTGKSQGAKVAVGVRYR